MLGLKLNHVSKRGHSTLHKYTIWLLRHIYKLNNEEIHEHKSMCVNSISRHRFVLLQPYIVCVLNIAVNLTTQYNATYSTWRHNERDDFSNHQPHHCLLNRLFRRWSKKTSKLRVTALFAGKSPGTGEFPAQMASNAEKVFIWWRHHDT